MANATRTATPSPVPATTAKKERKPRVKLSANVLETVQIIDEMPASARNGFAAKLAVVLKSSYENGKAVALTVSETEASALVGQIHNAASRANLGAQIRKTDLGDGMVQIAFKGKTRVSRPRKAKA